MATMPKKTPTIQDVARHACVSTATVSRALNNPERVSDVMRDKVNTAVQATGYTLNQAARSLRMRNTKTILVAMPNISNPFFSSILGAIESEAVTRGYSVLVANCTQDENSMERLQHYFRSNSADGLLLFDGSMSLPYLRQLFPDPERMPVVVACEEIPKSGFSTVKTNNFESSERATQYLIAQGHTRIAHVSAPRDNVLFNERGGGYHRALKNAHLISHEDYLVEGGFNIAGGIKAAQILMSLDTPPTAVFCANDETAIGFISQARKMGFSCPQDISVIGFDDIELAAHFVPSLTTIRQPREELGRLAAEALLDKLEGESSWQKTTRIVLQSELVARDSVAPPKTS